MENTRFKISQYACAVLLIVSSIALVSYQFVRDSPVDEIGYDTYQVPVIHSNVRQFRRKCFVL